MRFTDEALFIRLWKIRNKEPDETGRDMNERTVGTLNEDRACQFLTEHGYRIAERNYRCRIGELDVIAEENGYLCFIEVKYRRTTQYGLPEDAVGARKQATIRKVALRYLTERKIPMDRAMRFDVVAMDENEIRLYRNAF